MAARALSMRSLVALLATTGLVVFWSGSASAASPPAISEESVTNVAQTEADLHANINPQATATTYYVEYGTSEAYDRSTPPSGPIASDSLVTVHVEGLIAGGKYHFRFVASNSSGTTNGADATFGTYPAPVPPSTGCSNEARRGEQNALFLPDCRAYEMVSPIDKNGSDVEGSGRVTTASADGNAVAYAARAGLAGATGSGLFGVSQYVASRSADGQWITQGITPTPAPEAFQLIFGATVVVAASEDMSHAVVETYALPSVPHSIPNDINYYSENVATGALQTIGEDLGEETFFFQMFASLRGYSSDMGTITFETLDNLLPGLSGFAPKLYLWDHGTLSLAGVLPDGTLPPGGSSAAREQELFSVASIENNAGTVSSDGSKVAFVTPETGQLYLRRDGTSTAWVSESEASSPVAQPKNVHFWQMTPDGKKIAFTSGDPLTDSDPGGAGVGLYVYTDGPAPESEGNLTFVARINPGTQVAVNAISNDGKRIYFFTQKTAGFESAGTYLWDEGTFHLAFSGSGSLSELGAYGAHQWLQASSDGRRAVALTPQWLTNGQPVFGSIQAYVYDEASQTVRCASCLPTGTGTPGIEVEPNATASFGKLGLPTMPHFISADGKRVIFTTRAALVARDTNGVADVYEFDVETGAVSLLSPGTEQHGVWMASDSVSGNDVFVATQDHLLGSDTDTLADLYDIRVGGGVPQPAPATGPCQGDECQGVPSAAPTFNTASGFVGLGNVAKPKGAVKPRALTRVQKLSRALKRCKRKPTKARRRCIAAAHRRYGPQKALKGKSGKARR